VAVAADAPRAYAVARSIDMFRIGFVRRLFALRTMPDRISSLRHGEPCRASRSSTIDDIARAGTGFMVLGELPGREVVVGAIGKFWQPAIDFARVAPHEFISFDQPGYGKLAWCIRVDPRPHGGSFVSVEVRVSATDPASWSRFERSWSLIGPFSHAIRRSVLRLLVRELGRAPRDTERPLPGDELLEGARFQKTHATTIEAPVSRVWPWLVQMGARRAGWYSFDRLDNAGEPSADRIIAELQSLSVGDIIPALPKSPEGFAVLQLDEERALVLGDPSLLPGGERPKGAPPWKTTWAFVLEPIGHTASRLVVRVRAAYVPDLKMAVARPALTLAHEIMERRQLHNLRRRAEAEAEAAS
jgi:hypothetical protein